MRTECGWSIPMCNSRVCARLVGSFRESRRRRNPTSSSIWGDDIGYWNVSAYNQGMMGYKTPNIDRIAKEGALFTDWYGQQSCTAGRARFITGQSGFRTGMLKVGLPGAKEGLQARDVTIAELLKAQGYMTGAVRQEPPRRPRRAPADRARLRRVLRLALPPQRRGGVRERGLLQGPGDQEVQDARRDPLLGQPGWHAEDREHRPARPRSAWRPSTRRSPRRRSLHRGGEEGGQAVLPVVELRPACTSTRTSRRRARARPAWASIPTAWSSTTAMVGQMLDKLKELGLDDNTIVMYSTDNGAECSPGPMAGTTPFRGEKNTNWEGGYRVPCVMRWPGVIKPGTVSNDLFAHEDMLPTLLAAAGVPDVKEQLLKGMKVGNKTFKVHLDGYNITDALAGKGPTRATSSSTSTTTARWWALRYDQWTPAQALQPALRSVRDRGPRRHGLPRWRSSTCSCWCRRRNTSANFSRPSRSSPADGSRSPQSRKAATGSAPLDRASIRPRARCPGPPSPSAAPALFLAFDWPGRTRAAVWSPSSRRSSRYAS